MSILTTTQIFWLVIGLVVIIFCTWVTGIRVISNDQVAIVEKWWSNKGSLDEQIIALNGEAGYQPELLRGGLHFLGAPRGNISKRRQLNYEKIKSRHGVTYRVLFP